jgi:SET domain-containing protein
MFQTDTINTGLTVWCLISGVGVFALKCFGKGDFLMIYKGQLISCDEATQREKNYRRQKLGCFMYYFKHKGKEMWLVF